MTEFAGASTRQTSGDGRPSDETMRVIVVREHGGPEQLRCEEVPVPEPADDELLVRVRAAGVNPIDWMVREGYADDALDPSVPYVPGWDLSGTVEAVGERDSAFEPGDDVFGLVRMPGPGRTYAEYAAVPTSDVVRTPETLDHVQAASLPMVALTARRALFRVGALQRGQRVLVHAAAGGVGHLAVQLAADVGAHVVGTASGSNEQFLRALGVDDVVDYRTQRFESVVDDADLVLDAVGGDVLRRSIDAVREGGRIVTLPEPPAADVVESARSERDAAVHWFSVEPDAAGLGEIRERVEAGTLRPTVSDVLPLTEAAAAHVASETGHVRGKLVLQVGERTAPG